MKKLKLSLMVFVMSLGFAPFSFAAGAGGSQIVDATNGANAGTNLQGVGDNMKDGVNKVGDGVRDTVFESAYEKGGQEAEESLQKLESAVGQAGSSVSGLAQAVQALADAAMSCEKYTEVGVDCCKNPKNCGGTEESAAGQADQAANQTSQQAQQAAGGGAGGGGGEGGAGAAAQCLSALPGLMAMTGKSKGTSQACGLIRDGDGGRRGCSKSCEDVSRAAQEISDAGQSLMAQQPKQAAQISQFVNQARKYRGEADKSGQQCASETASGQQDANAQAGSGQQAMQGLMQCLQSLMNGEETQEEEEDKPEDPQVATNCASPAERAANPDYCLGYGSGDTGSGNLSKTSGGNGLFADGGDTQTDLPDDPQGADTVAGTPVAPLGNGAANAKTANPAFAALGSGSGAGANRKTGRRGKGKKGKDLIGGYKNTKGGGSGGGYGGRSPASKFKPFSFGKKKKKKKNKKALAALSKLMEAGISPDQSGSIFVRATKRFSSSSAKEKLFDARKNKSLWMDKRK